MRGYAPGRARHVRSWRGCRRCVRRGVKWGTALAARNEPVRPNLCEASLSAEGCCVAARDTGRDGIVVAMWCMAGCGCAGWWYDVWRAAQGGEVGGGSDDGAEAAEDRRVSGGAGARREPDALVAADEPRGKGHRHRGPRPPGTPSPPPTTSLPRLHTSEAPPYSSHAGVLGVAGKELARRARRLQGDEGDGGVRALGGMEGEVGHSMERRGRMAVWCGPDLLASPRGLAERERGELRVTGSIDCRGAVHQT
jgi:hypothetical protein